MQESLTGDLVRLIGVLDDLEELGDIMGEMLNDQEEVEVRLFFLLSKRSSCRIFSQLKCEEGLNSLQEQILTIRDLRGRYISYQTAFNELIVEITRRQYYKEAAENIVKGMMDQLRAMSEGERKFNLVFHINKAIH